MSDYLLDPAQYVENHISTNTGLYNRRPVQLLGTGIASVGPNSNQIIQAQTNQTLALVDIISALKKENALVGSYLATSKKMKMLVYLLLVLLIIVIVAILFIYMRK